MSAYWATEVGASPTLNISMNGANAVFPIAKPIDLKRIVLVIEALNSAQATMTLARRNVDNSSSVNLGTFLIPINSPVNTVYSVELPVPTAISGTSQPVSLPLGSVTAVQTSLPGLYPVNPGQELVLTSAGGGSGTVNFYYEFAIQGNNPSRYNPTKLTFTPT